MNHKFNTYELKENPPRDQVDFVISNPLVNQFEDIFSSLKGEPKNIRSSKGKIHLPYIIDFKANKQNLKVFKKKINQNNGTVILLIDGSGTMRFGDRDKVCRDLTANLFKAISEISRINLKVYIYGGSFEDSNVLAITNVNELNDCKKITHDGENYGSTPTHNAIHYVTKINENLKGKKIIITITDGKPELWNNHRQVSGIDDLLKLESKRALIEAESKGFNVFGIGIGLNEIESFKNMFRDEYINVKNPDDIKKYLMDKLSDFVRTIR